MIHQSMRIGFLAFVAIMLLQSSVRADLEEIMQEEGQDPIIEATAGYRWTRTDGVPQRAAEYHFLEDSPTFNMIYQQDFGVQHFSLLGDYANRNDYYLETEYDYKALLRLRAMTERLYHNLDHIPYQDHPEAPQAGEARYSDTDIGEVYNRRVRIDDIKVRGRLPNYPAHINLAIWRMEKKGREQLRFVDENCAGACHMQSTSQPVNRVTEEVRAGFDAHLGPVDIAFLQTLRKFREKSATPVDTFETHDFRATDSALDLQHDDTPDARMSESTLMINLPPSGGFVSSASYSIGTRENESDLVAVTPVEAETDYQKLAADMSYTPNEHWSMNFRYRMLELDSDVPASQTTNGITASASNGFLVAGTPQIPVRQSIDIDRNNYAAFLSYRPTHKLTFKGEYEREDLQRSNTGIGRHNTYAGIANLTWELPSEEIIDRWRLSFSSRLLDKTALKVNGWIEYTHVDNPAYSATLSRSNELFLSASYRPSGLWGATGSLDILRGTNDDSTTIQFDGPTPVLFSRDRDEDRENVALGLWYIPNETISADLNYGFLHARIAQDLLFGAYPDTTLPGGYNDYTIADDKVDYEQKVHTLTAGVNIRVTEAADCRLEGYHVRSTADYSPGFEPRDFLYHGDTLPVDAITADASQLKDVSALDIRQNGLKARINWNLSERLRAGFQFSYDDYDDRNRNAFDGTVQTIMASLTGFF